jgi:hypothetical protein
MFFISHRGNLNGPNGIKENKKSYLLDALNKGFDVEVDIWFDNKNFYLGHDSPQEKIDISFLAEPKVWCHAKNLEALPNLKNINAHFFWHQQDEVTITSKGFFWTFPGKKLFENSICVLPEKFSLSNLRNFNCAGVCSDYIAKVKND